MASSAYHIASLLDKVRHLMVSLSSGDSCQLFIELLPLNLLSIDVCTNHSIYLPLPIVWISNKECFFF